MLSTSATTVYSQSHQYCVRTLLRLSLLLCPNGLWLWPIATAYFLLVLGPAAAAYCNRRGTTAPVMDANVESDDVPEAVAIESGTCATLASESYLPPGLVQHKRLLSQYHAHKLLIAAYADGDAFHPYASAPVSQKQGPVPVTLITGQL